jgi:hypothetical protein
MLLCWHAMNGRAAQVAGAGPRQCRTSDIMSLSESSLATPCVQRSDRAEPVRGCFADVIAEARNCSCAREHVKIGSQCSASASASASASGPPHLRLVGSLRPLVMARGVAGHDAAKSRPCGSHASLTLPSWYVDYESQKVRCSRTCSIVALPSPGWSGSQVRDHTWLGPLFTWRGEGHTVIAARNAGSAALTLGRCYRIAGTFGFSSVIAMTRSN